MQESNETRTINLLIENHSRHENVTLGHQARLNDEYFELIDSNTIMRKEKNVERFTILRVILAQGPC